VALLLSDTRVFATIGRSPGWCYWTGKTRTSLVDSVRWQQSALGPNEQTLMSPGGNRWQIDSASLTFCVRLIPAGQRWTSLAVRTESCFGCGETEPGRRRLPEVSFPRWFKLLWIFRKIPLVDLRHRKRDVGRNPMVIKTSPLDVNALWRLS